MKTTITLFAIALSLAGCTSEETTTPPATLVGSWAGSCVPATQGSQRPVIGFSAGRISVKTLFYLGNTTCSGPKTRGTEATTADYTELGLAGDGLSTKINVTNLVFRDTREKTRHEAVLPRSFDIYYIENGLLYYGDYAGFDGSQESERPILFDNVSVATYLGFDTSDVF
jgi:hypothetical protein